MKTMKFTDFRTSATFDNWPSGRNRVECRFWVEKHPKRGFRIGKQTTGKPKFSTYSSGPAAIATGEDGKTYLLFSEKLYGVVKISTHDFMSPGDFEYWIDPRTFPELFAELTREIEAAQMAATIC